MRKCLYFTALLFFIFISAIPAGAVNVFKHYNKVIWIDQPRQEGAAYEKGKKLFSFAIMSGDDETPTPPGAYVVRVKDPKYYSKHYKQPMPLSIFFDFKGKRAIHEGEVPERKEMGQWATHGCIHVEQPYIQQLYDWTDVNKTLVVIRGRRDWALEDQIGEVDEGIQEENQGPPQEEQEKQKEDQENQEEQEDQGTQKPQKGQKSENDNHP